MNLGPQNFDSLRRMLALKKHEQPPPGYFDRFPNLVISRLRAGDRGRRESVLERLFDEAPWMQRLWEGLQAKPVFAGAFGVAVCALLISGLVYSANVDTGALRPSFMVNEARTSFVQPELDQSPPAESVVAFSTNPSTNPVPVNGSLFEEAQQAQPPIISEPASYTTFGN